MEKKASMTTAIAIGFIIGLVVLFLVLKIFNNNLSKNSNDIKTCSSKGGICSDSCAAGFIESGECANKDGQFKFCCVTFSPP